MLALPDADVAEALVEKFRGLGRYFGELAERQREGVAHGRVPAAFAVEITVEQIDRVLATPVADDALLTTGPPPSGMDVDAWKARLRDAVATDVRPGLAAYRDVLRDEVLPLRPPRGAVRPHLAARRRGGVRRDPALLHHDDQVRPGDPRHRDWRRSRTSPTSTAPRARGGRHRRPRADLRGHAHRSRAALRARGGAGRGLRDRAAAGVGRDARVVRGAAAGAVRREERR